MTPPPLPPATPLHVLLVDDDEVDRMAVRRALREADMGVVLTEAEDAEAAQQRLASRAFDCILLDLHLPRVSGLELLRQLRARPAPLPVVMLTGQGDEQTAVELMQAGASDYIPKAVLVAERLARALHHAVRMGRAEAQALAAREALRASEERFRTVARLSTHLVWVADPTGQRFDAPGWDGLTGLPDVRMQGRGWLEVVHADDRPRVERVWEEALAVRQPFQVEFRMRLRDGGWHWMVNRGVPMPGPGGTVREWVGGLTDITEQRLREEEVRRRVEFEQQLIGIVSHDLRNPLSAITASASMLGMLPATVQDERQRRAVGRIASSAHRANRMIETLLDFTRARLGGGIPLLPRPSDLHEAARRVVEEARAAHPARTLLLTCEGDASGLFDAERVEQVLSNLLGNALRYGAADTPVRVTCQGDGDEVLLHVHNLGNPIPRELQTRLFEPYAVGSRAEAASKGGLGLGLYIVRELVRAHGGSVDVASSAEAGTTFTVRLPRDAAAAT